LYQLRLRLAPIGKKFDNIAGGKLAKLRAKAAERTLRSRKTGDICSNTHEVRPAVFAARRSTLAFRFGIDDAAVQRGRTLRCLHRQLRSNAAVADLDTKIGPTMDAWRKLLESDLPALNQQLKQAGFPEIKTEVK